MEASIFKKIKKLALFLWNSKRADFYRAKFTKADFNPTRDLKSPQDANRIPKLLRSELSLLAPSARMYFPQKGAWHIVSTSGTSGQKPALFYIKYKDKGVADELSKARGKKVLLLNSFQRIYKAFNSLQNKDAEILVGDVYNLKATAYQAGCAKIECIVSSPGLLIDFAEHLRSYYDLAEIKLLYCTGELMTRLKWETLKNFFPRARIKNTYSSVETGLLGFPCDEPFGSGAPQTCARYHMNVKKFFFEIDSENRELIVTHLKADGRYGTPLLRYCTGDKASFVGKKCPCGRREPMMKIEGRLGFDFIKAGGGIISISELEKAIKQAGKVQDFLLRVSETIEGGKLKTKLVLEVAADETEEAFSAFIFSERLDQTFRVGPRTTLREAVERGLFLPLEVKKVKAIERPGLKKIHLVQEL